MQIYIPYFMQAAAKRKNHDDKYYAYSLLPKSVIYNNMHILCSLKTMWFILHNCL